MRSKPPFFRQKRPDSCALACLRMILAYHGIAVGEEKLWRKAKVDPGVGVWINDVAELAKALWGASRYPGS